VSAASLMSASPAALPPSVPPSAGGLAGQATDWSALRVYCGYRIAIVGALVFSHLAFGSLLGFTGPGPERVVPILGLYGAGAVSLTIVAVLRWPDIDLQVVAGVLLDVMAVVLLQHYSMERLGLGLLLPISVAAAALIARGRLAFFQAAIASVGLLGGHGMRVLHVDAPVSDFVPVGLASAACFATAGVGWALARYARASEALALERAQEVAMLSRVNERVVRDMPQGILLVDENGAVRTRNPAAERVLGPFPPGAALLLRDCSRAVAERWEAWRRGAEMPPASLLPPSGTHPGLALTFLELGSGRAGPAVLMLEDAGHLRKQALQLKLASLGRLTASIAHEIRNPLSSINQAAELLAEAGAGGPGDGRLVQIIRDNVGRLDRIVAEVLDMNRRARGSAESLDVQALLARFADDFCAAERVPRAGLQVEAVTGLRALADRHHVERVLWNVTRNAWRHGRQQPGSIRLVASAGMLPRTVAVDVADDGPGLSDEARAHLFEPFFTTDARGVGLGLFIARDLCEGEGGSLEAVEGPGGARFRITLREA